MARAKSSTSPTSSRRGRLECWFGRSKVTCHHTDSLVLQPLPSNDPWGHCSKLQGQWPLVDQQGHQVGAQHKVCALLNVSIATLIRIVTLSDFNRLNDFVLHYQPRAQLLLDARFLWRAWEASDMVPPSNGPPLRFFLRTKLGIATEEDLEVCQGLMPSESLEQVYSAFQAL